MKTGIGRRAALLGCLAPVAILGTFVGLIGLATDLADPRTHVPLDNERFHEPFPVLVVQGDTAFVSMVENPHSVPAPPTGASYLVPLGKERALQRYVNEHERAGLEWQWVLRVKPLTTGRQRIELFLIGDGYRGGVYDATQQTVIPQYRKITGPGFAFIAGEYALAMTLAVWVPVALAGGLWVRGRRRRAAQQSHAADERAETDPPAGSGCAR